MELAACDVTKGRLSGSVLLKEAHPEGEFLRCGAVALLDYAMPDRFGIVAIELAARHGNQAASHPRSQFSNRRMQLLDHASIASCRSFA